MESSASKFRLTCEAFAGTPAGNVYGTVAYEKKYLTPKEAA
jgi:hypothetical protein